MKMDLVIEAAERPRGDRSLRPAIAALAAALLYAFLWPRVTGDMRHFLLPWLDHILAHGMIGAFSVPFSNYSPPYLYLLALVSPFTVLLPKISVIKALSVIGTLVLAFAVRHLLRSAGGRPGIEPALWLVLLPSVAINAAGFGQCDAMWSAACVMAVASAAERRAVAMLIWAGIAISFKAQAVFLAPFVLLQLVHERTPLRFWAIPGLVYVAAMLPALAAGWPVADLATVYLRQAEWNPAFISTAANPWSLAECWSVDWAHGWFWAGHLAAAAAVIAYVFGYRRRKSDPVDLVTLAMLSACIVPFFLPKMHERFFFLADVLSFALAVINPSLRSIAIFALVQTASVLATIGVMLKAPLLPVIATPMMMAAMLLAMASLQARSKRANLEPSASRVAARETAVDDKRRTVHVAGLVGSQE